MIQRTRTRRAFTLLELLAVMWTLSLLLGFGAVILLAALRTDQLAGNTIHRITRNAELADLFRDDVARASETVNQLGEFSGDKSCLILKQGDTHIIYQWKNNALTRIARTGMQDQRRPVALGPTEGRVEFVTQNGRRPVISMRISDVERQLAQPSLEIAATLGGDAR